MCCVFVTLGWLLVNFPDMPPGNAPKQAEAEKLYVGEVIIVGNTVTQDRVILRQAVNLYPGQILQYADLRVAEEKLKGLNIFSKDQPPTVTVLDNTGAFKDILVKVKEERTGKLMLGAGVRVRDDRPVLTPVLKLVLEERNFDPRGWPTSWADLADGRAFRGAGRKLYIEFQIPPVRFVSRLSRP